MTHRQRKKRRREALNNSSEENPLELQRIQPFMNGPLPPGSDSVESMKIDRDIYEQPPTVQKKQVQTKICFSLSEGLSIQKVHNIKNNNHT